jgi:hypothetical protein
MREATARVKINKPLETAGWRFFGRYLLSVLGSQGDAAQFRTRCPV